MVAPATHYIDEWMKLRAALAVLGQEDLGLCYMSGYVPKAYQDSGGRILYVCASSPGYLADVFGPGPPPLKDDASAMDFAKALGALAKESSDPLANVAVTAFCKVAPSRGEVSPALLLAQQQLAVQTLRYEMYALEPGLVVFACGGKYSAAIRETINAPRGSRADFQFEGEGTEAFGFRPRGTAGEPAVLMLQPPKDVSSATSANWLAKAATLLR